MAIALRASNRAIGTFPNVPKLFNRHGLPMSLGLLNNLFGDDVVGVTFETSFFARKLFQVPFSRLGTTLLETLPKSIHPFAVLLNSFTAEGLTFGVRRNIHNAQINTERTTFRFVGLRCGYLKGHCEVENTIPIEQIGLPFDLLHSRLLVTTDTEGNNHAPLQCYEGDPVEPLESHHTRIINNSTIRSERGFDTFISLVRFTGFADTANSQLRGKLVCGTQLTIDYLLQLELISRLLVKSNFCDIVSCIIKGVHGPKQGLVLFSCGSKLQKHRLFHVSSIASLMKVVNGLKPNTPYHCH